MFISIKKIIPLDSKLRISYHRMRWTIARLVYWNPSKNMTIIWITGTNWKTTTTNIVARSLKESGKKVFMFSTVNYFIWNKEYRNDTKMTSPDPFVLQKLLKQAKEEWCEIAVIETSSHALFFSRVLWIQYDIAVLTNITQDHLDLHKTMDNYVKTKLRLFKRLIKNARKPWIKKTAIINLDSEYNELFLAETYDVLTTYWFNNDSTLKPLNITETIDWVSFDAKFPGWKIHIDTPLRWKHNIYNILSAIWVFLSLWLKPEQISKSISAVSWVPGRFEEVRNKENFKIFIDYAHTPDAIENILVTAGNIIDSKRIITVFGATWDRDKSKRPTMWKIVSERSDVVYLTEDDDYTEDVHKIVKDILPGINKVQWENFWIILNREDAIRAALLEAKKDDIVMILWKWDEHIMMTNNWPIEYNDKEVVLKILNQIDENKIV